MQDHEVVAAIVAGDPDGLAEAYDRYAASLYAYCHSMLSGLEAAAEGVRDTFIIAVSRLDGLRDPDRLGRWLHAVAQNECLRRLGPENPAGAVGAAAAAAPVPGPTDAGDGPPAVTPPAGLRGQVLTVCADNTPTGRAHRMSVTHRAGAFGPAGVFRECAQRGPGQRECVILAGALGHEAGKHTQPGSGHSDGNAEPLGFAVADAVVRVAVTVAIHPAAPALPAGLAGQPGAHVGER